MRRYINTIKFLKPIQIYYRLYYPLRAKFRRAFKIRYKYYKNSDSNILKLEKSIRVKSNYSNGEFSFLNLSKRFKDSIDWNYSEYGKLWTYNLTYFDFLSKRDDIFLIYDFIDNIESIKDGLEPFPISLRGVNWIKYISKYGIRDKKIDDSLYAQYYILIDNLEYHILGNHLLENGFSLLFGAYYFKDRILYKKGKEILLKELNEQILDDGGHFELTPMYHQIMLLRVLDSINLLKNNSWIEDNLLKFLIEKAEIMLGWLEAISYRDGDIPMFNDSTKDIAPTTIELFNYAKRLNIKRAKIELKESGYRKIAKENYELILDIGSISARYIAGHTHSDIFNFELRVNGRAFIVDSGITTYEVSKRRDIERSTKAHNTVEVNNRNQIEVWGGFRVGNRASVFNIIERDNYIEATHNGYGDILHTRRWSFFEDRVVIEDRLNRGTHAIFRLHFDNLISKDYIKEHIKLDSNRLKFSKYYLSEGFNRKIKSNSIYISFIKDIKTVILTTDKD